MNNLKNPTTVPYVPAEKVITSFNLLDQLLPDIEPYPNGLHYNTIPLDEGSIEYRIIQHMFTKTRRQGNHTIQSITKLRNKFVQEKFITRIKQDCFKYGNKNLT